MQNNKTINLSLYQNGKKIQNQAKIINSHGILTNNKNVAKTINKIRNSKK